MVKINGMKKKVIIIGAGGHAKVIADIILKNGDRIVGFLDDNIPKNSSFIGFTVLGIIQDFNHYEDCYFIVAIGNNNIRLSIVQMLGNVKWYKAIHPQAIISSISVDIGQGTVIMANAVVNSGAYIGKHCIINTSAVVEHDNIIKDYVHISVGVKLGGACVIDEHTWIGIGATIKNNIKICSHCMIGAGAVIVKNITSKGIYVGVPARKASENKMNKRLKRGGGYNSL